MADPRELQRDERKSHPWLFQPRGPRTQVLDRFHFFQRPGVDEKFRHIPVPEPVADKLRFSTAGQKSVQRPRCSQSPYRVGSGPLGPPISRGVGRAGTSRDTKSTSLAPHGAALAGSLSPCARDGGHFWGIAESRVSLYSRRNPGGRRRGEPVDLQCPPTPGRESWAMTFRMSSLRGRDA